MKLAPGTKLGPYEIVSPIGAGGMGEVYRAQDSRVGRDVAIKVSSEQFSDRFTREIHAVAALNHSNICTLYDVGANYLVMELVEGPTLADRIKQGRSLWMSRSRSRVRLPTGWKRPTKKGSCTATSSRETSRSGLTAR